jgi:hypothetical protein
MSHIAVDALDVLPVGSPAAADMHPTSANANASAALCVISLIVLTLAAFDTDLKQTTGEAFRPAGVAACLRRFAAWISDRTGCTLSASS